MHHSCCPCHDRHQLTCSLLRLRPKHHDHRRSLTDLTCSLTQAVCISGYLKCDTLHCTPARHPFSPTQGLCTAYAKYVCLACWLAEGWQRDKVACVIGWHLNLSASHSEKRPNVCLNQSRPLVHTQTYIDLLDPRFFLINSFSFALTVSLGWTPLLCHSLTLHSQP